MNNAERYEKIALALQGREIEPLLQEFKNEISKMKGVCVDIGCGPGNVSRKIILPKLPLDTILVGIDISKNMIDYARTANVDEKRMTFEEMNIETINLNLKNIERFDNGLSFFCLHFIQNLRIGFKNIFEMLRPGGSFIIHYLANMDNFSSYIKLAENPKYKKYMTDVMQFIPRLLHDPNPTETLTEILKEVGFEILHCSLREKNWEYKDENERKELFYSVNPYIERLPENMKEEYIQDLLREMSRQRTMRDKDIKNSGKEQNIFDMYKYLVVLIKKPSN